MKKQQAEVKESPFNLHLWAGKTPENTQLVQVLWRDIQDVGNWNDEQEVAPARKLASLGHLLYEGPDPKDRDQNITVTAKTYDYETGKWSEFTAYPSEVVREIRVKWEPAAPRKRRAK